MVVFIMQGQYVIYSICHIAVIMPANRSFQLVGPVIVPELRSFHGIAVQGDGAIGADAKGSPFLEYDILPPHRICFLNKPMCLYLSGTGIHCRCRSRHPGFGEGEQIRVFLIAGAGLESIEHTKRK